MGYTYGRPSGSFPRAGLILEPADCFHRFYGSHISKDGALFPNRSPVTLSFPDYGNKLCVSKKSSKSLWNGNTRATSLDDLNLSKFGQNHFLMPTPLSSTVAMPTYARSAAFHSLGEQSHCSTSETSWCRNKQEQIRPLPSTTAGGQNFCSATRILTQCIVYTCVYTLCIKTSTVGGGFRFQVSPTHYRNPWKHRCGCHDIIAIG